jgi:tRNA (guanine-N7-)-methyltransferase
MTLPLAAMPARTLKMEFARDSGLSEALLEQIRSTTAPVEIEIGAGKGKFLLERAALYPDTLFVGIDWARKWLSVAAERALKTKRENLHFVWGFAPSFIEALPSDRISIFHMYFPDPWPKRRHHARRTFSPAFLNQLHVKLVKGGRFELATDHEDYWQAMRKTVAQSLPAWSRFKQSDKRFFMPSLRTAYEIKYETAGKRLYFMELIK